MGKKLLIDYFGVIKPILTEDSDGAMTLRGEFGRADVPTENKRIYPRSIWEREIARVQPAIAEGKVLSITDHPQDGKTSLKQVSGVMKKLEMLDDGTIIGEMRLCDNEHGRQLKSIKDAGGAIGVSSRGMGSTQMNESGYEVVQEDYTYMTHDCVADPAVKSSYPEFSSESKEIKKETVMETKVEKKETKPVVETAAPKESPEVITETKVETAPVITEDKLKEAVEAKVKELEEAHKKDLETKLSEAKLAFEKDPKAVAGRIVLEDVAKLLRPVLLPEDVQSTVKEKETVIEAKDKEISDLKKKIQEETDKGIKYAKMAHDLGMLLHFEKTVTEGIDKEAVRKIIGDPKKFEKHQDLTEAIDGATSALKRVMEENKAKDKTEEILKADFEKKLSEEKKRADETQKKLEEAVTLAKGIGIRAYVLERTKNNPNAPKILKLVESCKSKEEADALIEKFGVDTPSSQEYTAVRNRFKKFENTTLVEEQLRETGIGKKPATKVVLEGVEAEMNGLFPGASLEQVRDLSGV